MRLNGGDAWCHVRDDQAREHAYYPGGIERMLVDSFRSINAEYLTSEGLKPFTCEEFADGWLKGLVCDAISNGELTDKTAAEFPDYANQP